MNLYEFEYRDSSDPACPIFTSRVKGYNLEHAIEKWCDSPNADGWIILRAAVVRPNKIRSEWNWQKLDYIT